MDLDRAREILERLRPTLAEEGLALEVLGPEGSTLRLRGRRTAQGAPTAFLVRAVEGTFRRYTPDIQAVRLEEYESSVAEEAPSSPRPPGPPLRGVTGVDLSGLDRRRAARALETFMDLARRRGAAKAKIRGLAEDAPRRAAEKWSYAQGDALRSLHPEAGRPGSLVVHFDLACGDPECCAGEEEEIMPGSVVDPSLPPT